MITITETIVVMAMRSPRENVIKRLKMSVFIKFCLDCRHFDRLKGVEKSPTHFAGDFSIPLRSTRNDERSCYLMNCVIKITVIASGARNFMIKYMIFLNPILAVPPLVNSS